MDQDIQIKWLVASWQPGGNKKAWLISQWQRVRGHTVTRQTNQVCNCPQIARWKHEENALNIAQPVCIPLHHIQAGKESSHGSGDCSGVQPPLPIFVSGRALRLYALRRVHFHHQMGPMKPCKMLRRKSETHPNLTHLQNQDPCLPAALVLGMFPPFSLRRQGAEFGCIGSPGDWWPFVAQ